MNVSDSNVQVMAFDQGSKILVTKDHGILERFFGRLTDEVITIASTKLAG